MNWQPGMAINVQTEHYVMPSMTVDDLTDEVVAWFSDPEVMDLVALPMNLTREQLAGLVRQTNNNTFFMLLIRDKETNAPVGIYRIWRDLPHESARTAVIVGNRDYWGKKVVLETRAGLLVVMFDLFGVHKVVGAVYARNHAAIFNYKAQGFRCEGVFRKHERGHDGEWLDVMQFAMLREEFEAARRRRRI
ncbi:MAG: GNAT family protein [Alphaproteobacteria bacterium]|nr:GNAT family protein [Alphaproteobacteria bacterium]